MDTLMDTLPPPGIFAAGTGIVAKLIGGGNVALPQARAVSAAKAS
jgi:hypothetical protein